MALQPLSFGGDQASAGGGTINNNTSGSGFPFSAPTNNQGLLVVGGLAVLWFLMFRKKGR